ncbi:MAG TPA: GIY-YIG nuclease family protein [Candidatus Levybacteria bacterium]|nr:GIY-YIG nuclease family protein [Candidatus Levybacteria bacterium]
MPWYVYILFCDKKTYYVGLTHNVAQRLKSHTSKQNIGTKEFSYIELVFTEEHLTRKDAEKREKQIKGWTVAKKRALLEGNLELLKQLSKSRSVSKDNSGKKW